MADPMPPLDLDAIEARIGYVQRGPWHAGRTVGRTVYCGNAPDDLIGVMDTRELAAFVAAAITDIPALVARVRALEADQQATRAGLAAILLAYGPIVLPYNVLVDADRATITREDLVATPCCRLSARLP